MEDRLAPLRQDFLKRAHVRPAWAGLAYLWPRNRLTWLLAALPCALLLLAALASGEIARAMTEERNVDALFARFISAVATAATVAVSVAALVLGRELKGIAGHDERHDANMEFRDGMRRAAGSRSVPMAMGSFLSLALETVAKRAREARAGAAPGELAHQAEGVTLGGLLAHLEAEATRASKAVLAARRHPHRLLTAALGFEQEVVHHLSRRFAREEELSPATREAVARVSQAIRDVVVSTRYVKTLDTQWGLSRMSSAVLLSTLPAILVAASMVLAYGEGLVRAWGILPAAGVVCAALAVTLLPITAIVAYLLRFVFINQHTLPAEDFVLGPELPDVVDDRVPSGVESPRRGRAGSS